MKRIIFLAVILTNLYAQEVIDVGVRGVSDNQRDGVQKDRLEAILDAKRQACERPEPACPASGGFWDTSP